MKAREHYGSLEVRATAHGKPHVYRKIPVGEVSSSNASDRTKRRRASELHAISKYMRTDFANTVVHGINHEMMHSIIGTSSSYTGIHFRQDRRARYQLQP